ncbi:mitochondrial import receptor subunit TOM70-like [Drosophila obscura]|uniref:mitochondrial import receptor subunit TOM70-like n=1 Tax=Drosophila obscura TaxID=7282 RepID=UPI001BB228AC|nr:mitochondrial import receptor subunit TOM70-like [Drosophila obscura]
MHLLMLCACQDFSRMPGELGKWSSRFLLFTPLVFPLCEYIKTKMIDRSMLEAMQTLEAAELEASKNEPEMPGQGAGAIGISPEMSSLCAAINYKKDGNDCFYKRRYVEAIDLYSKAIEKCPKEHTEQLAIFYQNRAACHQILQNWTQVKKECAKALEYNHRYAKAYYRRARAYEATSDLEKCLIDITATCLLEDCRNKETIKLRDSGKKKLATADAKRRMDNLGTALPSKRCIPPLRGLLRAHRAFIEERFEDVISACTEEIESATEADSQYKLQALFMRGTLHLLCGSTHESRRDYMAVLANLSAYDNLRIYTQVRCAMYDSTIPYLDIPNA